MHGVAAEIAQKITVLFQDNNPDPGAGKQKSVNHAGGTTTGNTNLGLQNLCHGPTLLRGMAGSVGQLSSLDRVRTRPRPCNRRGETPHLMHKSAPASRRTSRSQPYSVAEPITVIKVRINAAPILQIPRRSIGPASSRASAWTMASRSLPTDPQPTCECSVPRLLRYHPWTLRVCVRQREPSTPSGFDHGAGQPSALGNPRSNEIAVGARTDPTRQTAPAN